MNAQSYRYTEYDTLSPLAFGFLAGKEVASAGVTNLGVRDRECSLIHDVKSQCFPTEIFALEWVKRNIAAFGGDSNRVVLHVQIIYLVKHLS